MKGAWFTPLAGQSCLHQCWADVPQLQLQNFVVAQPRRSLPKLAVQVEKLVLQRYSLTSVLVSS
jgi:hypothetical protein